jgi:acyl-CoA thioester hydrolase
VVAPPTLVTLVIRVRANLVSRPLMLLAFRLAGTARTMIYEHRFRVRYAETDQMGIAHHANYLIWFEMARVEWSRALGLPWGEIEASGFAQAVHRTSLTYRRPARFDQLLAMRVALVEMRGPRMRFGYRLYDATDLDFRADEPDVLSFGTIELVWVTPDGRPTRLPKTHAASNLFAAMETHPDYGD